MNQSAKPITLRSPADAEKPAVKRLVRKAFKLAGHSDIRTTKRYFHTAEDQVRQAMIAAESRNTPEPVSPVAQNTRKAAND